MKALDVITQLVNRLPRISTNFTTNIDIISASVTTGTATVETLTDHNLNVGNFVNVVKIPVPVEISTVVENSDGTIDIETSTNHDLTKNPLESIDVEANITDIAYNETFEVIAVTNRRNFTVNKGGLIAPSTGFSLQQQFISGYNGLKEVLSIPTSTTFTYSVEEDLAATTDTEGAYISFGHRITGAVRYEVARLAYTEQTSQEKMWLFVVIDDTSASKDRRSTNDAAATRGTHQFFFQQIVENFTIFLFVSNKGQSKQDVGGIIARDAAINERGAILASIIGKQISSGLDSQGQYTITYNGDGFMEYIGPFYVHYFTFEQIAAITNPDTSIESDDHAFRDITFSLESLGIQENTDTISAGVDLDDEPL